MLENQLFKDHKSEKQQQKKSSDLGNINNAAKGQAQTLDATNITNFVIKMK